MAKKKKNTFNEYKLKVETKSGDVVRVKLTLFDENDRRQGASIVIMDDLVIKGIWIVNGKNGPFVSWPSYKSDDEYKEYVHPVSAEFRESLYKQMIRLSAFGENDDEED